MTSHEHNETKKVEKAKVRPSYYEGSPTINLPALIWAIIFTAAFLLGILATLFGV